MPPAARITDLHNCPRHGKAPLAVGESTVLIGNQPAARVGDALACDGAKDLVSQGEPTVLIGNQDAARLGDPTEHGGILIEGCPSVLIGSTAQARTMKTDKPFCEICEAERRAREFVDE